MLPAVCRGWDGAFASPLAWGDAEGAVHHVRVCRQAAEEELEAVRVGRDFAVCPQRCDDGGGPGGEVAVLVETAIEIDAADAFAGAEIAEHDADTAEVCREAELQDAGDGVEICPGGGSVDVAARKAVVRGILVRFPARMTSRHNNQRGNWVKKVGMAPASTPIMARAFAAGAAKCRHRAGRPAVAGSPARAALRSRSARPGRLRQPWRGLWRRRSAPPGGWGSSLPAHQGGGADLGGPAVFKGGCFPLVQDLGGPAAGPVGPVADAANVGDDFAAHGAMTCVCCARPASARAARVGADPGEPPGLQ